LDAAARGLSSKVMAAAECTHLDSIQVLELPEEIAGCEECLALGTHWVHLRMCMTCGHIGCCDNSPLKHATAHNRQSSHPIIRSAEPGEDWSWCYPDELMMRIIPR
jgi:Zn-finger in ubiquitin-hydrolases and other protein